MNDDPAAGPDPSDSDPPDHGPSNSDPFPGPAVAGGVIGSIAFPVVSLIAALMLMGREANPVRREALRRWAVLSGGLIAAQAVIALIFLASIASNFNNGFDRDGPCVGGPEIGSEAVEDENGTAVFPCSGGGSVTVNFSDTAEDEDFEGE